MKYALIIVISLSWCGIVYAIPGFGFVDAYNKSINKEINCSECV